MEQFLIVCDIYTILQISREKDIHDNEKLVTVLLILAQ